MASHGCRHRRISAAPLTSGNYIVDLSRLPRRCSVVTSKIRYCPVTLLLLHSRMAAGKLGKRYVCSSV
jgi:hypothetical protein